MRRILVAFAVTGMLAAWPHAQTNLSTLGPQVGQRAIDFSLPDQQDRVPYAEIARRAEGHDARVLPFGRLVTVLPHAARAAATFAS